MMHLSEEALLALAETGDRHPHLERCAACRARVDVARDALLVLREDPVPEPSPLFWDHFSARVRTAIAAEGSPGPRRAFTWRVAWKPAVAVGLAACALVAFWSTGILPPRDARFEASQSAGREAVGVADASPVEGDRAWDVVVEVAGHLDAEAAADAAYPLRPGSADAAVLSLSPDEQREFVRLLQAAIDDPSQ